DAVDVEEPVHRAPAAVAAGPPVDRLDEPAAVARAHLRVALEQAHDGVRPAALGGVGLHERVRPEVLADDEVDVRRRPARAEPAAAERDRGHGGGGEGEGALSAHAGATSTGKAGTS